MVRALVLVSLTLVAGCAASQPSPEPPPGPSPSRAAGPLTAPDTGPPAGKPAPVAAAPSGPRAPRKGPLATVREWHVRGEVHEGASCAAIGATPLLDAQGVRVEGSTLAHTYSTGCGCPTGPHFTFVVEPATSPLRVRACAGLGTDSCEAACHGTLRYDLSASMQEGGAKEILLVR